MLTQASRRTLKNTLKFKREILDEVEPIFDEEGLIN